MKQFSDILISSWLAPLGLLFFVNTGWCADHIHIRNSIINSQLAQVDGATLLVVGDSIVESWFAKPIGSCQILNGGLGGGGVSAVMSFLNSIKENPDSRKLNGIIVAVGVNDAHIGKLALDYLANWNNEYLKMVELALKINSKVSLSTILPVENDMPLGTKYFDPMLIEQMNVSIRQIAKDKGVHLIDGNEAFRRAQWNGHYTVDGVHLTVDAYKVFIKELQFGVPNYCRSSLIENKPVPVLP